ncbi:MAG: hypothetical protein Q4B72_05980 [Lachnospiraceae bacterium]|nr:hypothetical protein [Lachnospiraceae bacterium]
MKTPDLVITARKMGDESTAYTRDALHGLCIDLQETDKRDAISRIVHVTITNEQDADFIGVIRFEVEADRTNPRYLMPGFMYGRNTGEAPNFGRKEFPRIREQNCIRPESNDWMVRSDRLAAPVSLVFDEDTVYGISAAPHLTGFNGFTCSLLSGKAAAGFTLGYENAPWLFIQTATVCERAPLSKENCITIAAGQKLELTLCIYTYEAAKETDLYEAMRHVYEHYHEAPRKIEGMDVQKATKLLAHAVAEDAWLPDEKMYTGFVFDGPDGDTYNKILSFSWTNGLAVAVPMLLAAQCLEDERMRAQALGCIEYICGSSLNPASGLPYDALEDGVWSIRGWWYDGMRTPGHTSYLCGQGTYYILRAYEYEKKRKGACHKNFLDFADRVVRKMNTTLNGDYEYPFVMSEKSGAGLQYDSFAGCWCLAAATYLAWLTGDTSDLEMLRRSEKHYYDAYVSRVECYGAPIDTDKAVDSEGILAYIRAVKYLHLLTGDDTYLEHMRDALYYEFTFKLCYNTHVVVPPLSEIGWSSCGGSITSTANPHIHPMSSTIVDELIYYVEKTHDPYAKERLLDTIGWGLQTFNTYDKEYGYGRIGWMSERFCFCQGLVTQKYPDGSPASTWFALMPWASASIIDGFAGECYSNTLLQSL